MDFNDQFAEAWEWARMYRDLGLAVVPAHTPHAGAWKRPVLAEWKEFQDALVPESLHERWYNPVTGEHRKRRNMGIITGEASGRLVVVDLDVGETKDGRIWWNGLLAVEANGLEPETVSQITGGGGRQLLFRAPEGWTPPTFKASPVGVDLRGNGGFIMAPPSLHSSGQIYDFEPGRAPWLCEILTAPDWLCAAIDRLRLEHGGGATGPREHVASEAAKGPFGHDVDDREHKLQAAVWAAVVDLRRDCPILPSQGEQEAEIERLWTQYEATTRTRLERVPGASNADLLEREGRGISELRAKWAYAIAKWETKVAEAALIPKPEETWAAAEPVAVMWDDAPAEPDATPATLEGLGIRRLSTVTARPAPRRWAVENWIPHGEVTLIASGPGLGKSLLALQLACSMAIGVPWLGLNTTQSSCLFVTCEDSDDELDMRFADVKDGLGTPLSAPFDRAMVASRQHKENRLTQRGPHGVLGLGPFHGELTQALAFARPDVLVLDTLADFFTGNENDRSEVNWFVKAVLGGLIAASQGRLSVILLGHTSKAAGSEFSGSSAWEGAVRSRLFLERPDQGGPTERTLSRSKANYAGGDDGSLALMWEAGMFRALNEIPNGHMVQLVRTVIHAVDHEQRIGRGFTSVKGDANNLYRALPKLLTTPQQTDAQVREAIRRAIQGGQIIKASGQRPVWKKADAAWEA